MKRFKEIKPLIATFILSGLLYIIFDSAKLFYCINIYIIIIITAPLIYHRILKTNWGRFKKSEIKQLIFITIFFSIIFLPLLQQLTGFISLSEIDKAFNEKRKLADFKLVDNSDLKGIPDKFTTYYNDNFGLRKFLITTNNYVKARYFKISSKSQAIIGNGEWMFYNSQGSLTDHQGKKHLKKAQLDKIKSTLIERKKYLTQKGIKYFVAVLPDKMSIYPNHLPSNYKLVDTTRLDQVLSSLKNTNIPIIDLRHALKKEANNKLLYQVNDSHWNNNGGFIGAKEIINMLRQEFKNIPTPYSIDNFKITEKDKKGGDISMLLGIKAFSDNSSFIYEPNEKVGTKKAMHNSLYNFYKQDYKATFIYEKQNKSLPKILIFNDSFVSYIHRFLGDYFSRSVFLWTHDFRKDIIQKEQPEIVLHIIVERSIEDLGKSAAYKNIPN